MGISMCFVQKHHVSNSILHDVARRLPVADLWFRESPQPALTDCCHLSALKWIQSPSVTHRERTNDKLSAPS